MEKKQMRVLLVEDDPTDREALERFVTRQNLPYEIDSVESKKGLLLKLHQNKYDVILMDYKLPDSTGIDLLQIVGDVPVIMVTGSGDEKTAVESIRKGAYDYLVKDPNRNYLELLPITIENVLARKQAEKMLETERQKLFSILDELPGFVYLLKPDHSIAFSNRRFQELFGDPRSKTCYEVIKKKKEPCEECPTLKVHDSKIPQEWEWTSSAGQTYQIYDYPFTDTDGSSLVLKLGIDITKRKRAEEKLNKKTEFIQLVQEITVTANEASTVEEAIQVCLDKVCDYMNWPVGHVYIADSKGTLIPSKIWHIENAERFKIFREVTEVTSFDIGVGLPGRVLATGKPEWITDVTHDQDFPRAKSAKDIGVKAAFALPVLEGEKVVAVLEFFAGEAIEPDVFTLEALSNLAVQVGRVTERKRAAAEKTIRTQAALLSAEVDSAVIGGNSMRNLLQSCAEAIVRNLNMAFARIWTVNWDKNMLELQASAGMYTHIDGDHARIPVGKLKIGLIVKNRKPFVTNKALDDIPKIDKDWAKREGMVAFAGYPLIVENQVIGVIGTFSQQPLLETTLKSLSAVASGIAIGVKRMQVEEELHKKTELLKLVQEITITVNEATTADEAMQICIDKICSFTKWPVGHVYITDSKRTLIPSKIWHIKNTEQFRGFRKATEDTSFDPGVGLPGRVLASGKPYWVTDVTKVPWFLRTKISKDIGVKAGFAFPVLEGEKVEAVLEFFSDEVIEPDESILEALSNLAVQVGRVTERKRAAKERKNMEEKFRQKQKLESLGVLAGGIAHDFNNILTTILGNTELALDNLSPDSPLRNYIEEIEKGATRAAELSQEMLAYSGRGKFVIKNIDVNELIKEITRMLNVSISKKHTIKYDLTENLPSVEVDITQIRQVIMNLIINASEAIGQNIGVISIATGAMECDKNHFKKMYLHDGLTGGLYNFIEVTDTGVGMDKDTIEKIFDPFFTTKFAGRGLGMSAVLGIIRGHKGAINVESEPGKGTKFTVFLPASGKALSAAKSGREETAAPWRGRGTVLVVDDEKTVSDVGKSMLEKMGFNVLTASDGQEAVEIFRDRSNEIDGVLLDFTMPRMNGEECFLELRKIRKDVRVIMYSGYSDEATIQRFFNQGVNEFLQKPFLLKTLRNKMRKVFESD